MNKLKHCLPTDDRPFSGTRILPLPIKVKLRVPDDSFFSPTSMLGENKEDYIAHMRSAGITEGKVYLCTEVEGYGDVADIKIDQTDTGASMYFMSGMFEDAKGDENYERTERRPRIRRKITSAS